MLSGGTGTEALLLCCFYLATRASGRLDPLGICYPVALVPDCAPVRSPGTPAARVHSPTLRVQRTPPATVFSQEAQTRMNKSHR